MFSEPRTLEITTPVMNRWVEFADHSEKKQEHELDKQERANRKATSKPVEGDEGFTMVIAMAKKLLAEGMSMRKASTTLGFNHGYLSCVRHVKRDIWNEVMRGET